LSECNPLRGLGRRSALGEHLVEEDDPALIDGAVGGDADGHRHESVVQPDTSRPAVADGAQQVEVLEVARPVVEPLVGDPLVSDDLAADARSAPAPLADSHLAGREERLDLPGLADGSAAFDLVFSVFYDKIIRADFIDSCRRILNLHNGPLPRYRGVSPVNWALKNGEGAHGTTIHEITPGIDDGPIVSQVTYSIYPDLDEVEDAYARSLEYGYTLFAQTMPLLDRIVVRPQDDSRATYYSSAENELLGERRHFTRRQSAGGG